jgi:glycosyltransferase involved in cell wall biosynthesis
MSVYNESKEALSISIDSILNQEFQDLEFIIVDDGSDGEVKEVLERFARRNQRIKLITSNINKGLAASLNLAVKEADGKFIARMDSDDISHPLRLRRQIEYLNHNPSIDVVGCQAIKINGLGNKLGKIKTPTNSEQMPTHLLFNSCLVHPSVMVRSDFYKKTGGYSNSFLKAQDYDLWARGSLDGFKYSNIKEFLLSYRVYNSSISSAKLEKQALFSDRVREKYISSIVNDVQKSEIQAFLCLASPIGKSIEPFYSSFDSLFLKLAKSDALDNVVLSKHIVRRCGALALKHHNSRMAASILTKWFKSL